MRMHRAIILLAAGSGSRLRPLTNDIPKCLLKVGDKTVLDWMLSSVLTVSDREVVIVTGYFSEKIEEHIKKNHSYADIKVIKNCEYSKDVNILSVNLGVESLKCPENGYTIIETDLLLDDSSWAQVLNDSSKSYSYWVTRGVYSNELMGGIVHVDETRENIDQIAYVPDFNPKYNGWHKMIGILSVGPEEVASDMHLRKIALKETFAQYYMMPWIKNLKELPCKIMDLGMGYAVSFNTSDDFQFAGKSFLEHIQK